MIVLTKPEKRVLEYLGKHGPSIGNQMSKSPGLSSKTASTAPRSLEKKGLVSRRNRRTFARPASEYSLTLKGLAQVLTLGTPERHISFSVKHWKHLLPGILDKWSFFRDQGVLGIAQKRLLYAAEWFIRPIDEQARLEYLVQHPLEYTPPTSYLVVKGTELGVFVGLFYDLRIMLAYREKWVEACVKDPLLINTIKSQIGNLIDEAEHDLKEYRAIAQALRKAQRPEPSE